MIWLLCIVVSGALGALSAAAAGCRLREVVLCTVLAMASSLFLLLAMAQVGVGCAP